MTSSIGRLVDPLGILEYVNDFVDSFRRAYRTATANSDMTVTVHCPCGTPWSYPPSRHYGGSALNDKRCPSCGGTGTRTLRATG
jgi:hypothetical protein